MMMQDDMDVLGQSHTITITELCRVCHVDQAWLEELIAHGALQQTGASGFTALSITRVRKARRLEQDLDLNAAGAALALDLLDEIERLRAMIRQSTSE